MNERLQSLYKKYILEYSKKPFNEFKNEGATEIITAYNPLCGDKFTFYLTIKDERIEQASFTGYGCSISKASSSVLTKKASGRTISELLVLIEDFLKIVEENNPQSAGEITEDEELVAFSGAREFPERKQCAVLGWEELRDKFSAL